MHIREINIDDAPVWMSNEEAHTYVSGWNLMVQMMRDVDTAVEHIRVMDVQRGSEVPVKENYDEAIAVIKEFCRDYCQHGWLDTDRQYRMCFKPTPCPDHTHKKES